MNTRDYSFLLLTGKLGDPNRKPLTTAQVRLLAERFRLLSPDVDNTNLSEAHLSSMGIPKELSQRVLALLEDDLQLAAYLARADKAGCFAVTRTNPQYPLILRKRLGNDAPGCLWMKGDSSLLQRNSISLVGSRELQENNRLFARDVGIQAARQGFVLVSGNARGADITAQRACLAAGGGVISVVADSLADHAERDNVLYISEEDFDEPFSAQRALHRNRIIHALGLMTFVAQCTYGKGGTWSGTSQNLRKLWSPLFCFDDGSEAMSELERMGAKLIDQEELSSFQDLSESQMRFL